MIDGRYGSYLGDGAGNRVTVNQEGLILRPGPAGSSALRIRFTARKPGQVLAMGCLRSMSGPQAQMTLSVNGRTLSELAASTKGEPVMAPATLRTGDAVDFRVTVSGGAGAARLAYRFRIANSADAAIECPSLPVRKTDAVED